MVSLLSRAIDGWKLLSSLYFSYCELLLMIKHRECGYDAEGIATSVRELMKEKVQSDITIAG
jgi:hypothetical protein